jgi:RHS repeat-associated protein
VVQVAQAAKVLKGQRHQNPRCYFRGRWRRTKYTYDAFNRLVGRTETVNTYEGESTEPATTTTTSGHFVYDGTSMVLMLDGDGNVTDRVLYGPAVDQVLADEQVGTPTQAGTVVWTLGDNQNTVRDLAVCDAQNAATTIATHRVFSAFGERVSQTNVSGTYDTPFNYTARFYDQATELQWNLDRWYKPSIQRWMGQDPTGLIPDVNPYRYCGNGPTDTVDPMGMQSYDWTRKELRSLPPVPGLPPDSALTRPGGLTLEETYGTFAQRGPQPEAQGKKPAQMKKCRFDPALGKGVIMAFPGGREGYGKLTTGPGGQKLEGPWYGRNMTFRLNVARTSDPDDCKIVQWTKGCATDRGTVLGAAWTRYGKTADASTGGVWAVDSLTMSPFYETKTVGHALVMGDMPGLSEEYWKALSLAAGQKMEFKFEYLTCIYNTEDFQPNAQVKVYSRPAGDRTGRKVPVGLITQVPIACYKWQVNFEVDNKGNMTVLPTTPPQPK